MKTKIIFFLFIMITLIVTGRKDDKESERTAENVSSIGKVVRLKNETELQATWDNIEKKIDENPDILNNIKQIYSRDLQANPPSSTQTALQQLNQLLHDPNSNPSAASSALEFFVKVDANDVIRESLLNPRRDVPGWGLVIIASKAITAKRDEKALPNLIYVMEKNNYIQEGSEAATVHQHMKRKLIEAIQAIIGSDIDINKINVNNPQEIEHILFLARDWAKKNNIKLLDE